MSKVFEKCVYKYLHNYIVANNLLTPHQSGFTHGDSTINQLLFLSNEISQALDSGKEIRIVFFDISKAFDRVWHKGLILKLKSFGVGGSLLGWIKDYLSFRKQKVIIKGKESTLLTINAGVPQGSILGPLLFLIFINDIVLEIGCSIKLFADDTTIYVIIEDKYEGANTLNLNLNKVHQWSEKWLVTFNPQKTECLLISRKSANVHPTLYLNDEPIQEVSTHKHLGLVFNKMGQWGDQIDSVIKKASTRLNVLRRLKFTLDRRTLQTMYFSFVRPILEYGDIIWDNCQDYNKDKLEKINIEAARIVTGATKLVGLGSLYAECGWEKLETRREQHKLTQLYKMLKDLTPEYLQNLIPPLHAQRHAYNTRHSHNIVNLNCRTTHHLNSFLPSTIRLWNNLPDRIKNLDNITAFKRELKACYNLIDVPSYYYTGTRKGQILHSRLRMRCSALKQHLYLKNIEPDPFCACGSVESTEHYLLYCKYYNIPRRTLMDTLGPRITTNVLLYGDENKNYQFNKRVFISTQKYILETKRFL